MPDAGSDDLNGRAYIGLGSNVGDREANVLGAARLLSETGVGRSLRLSALYETEPVGCAPMAPFVNAVAELQPLLWDVDLLKRLRDLERRLGRSGGHNEPREIDLDVIALGQRVIDTETLTVPHPRYHERAFVLAPLLELAPDFRCPRLGVLVKADLESLAGQQVVTRISTRRVVFA